MAGRCERESRQPRWDVGHRRGTACHVGAPHVHELKARQKCHTNRLHGLVAGHDGLSMSGMTCRYTRCTHHYLPRRGRRIQFTQNRGDAWADVPIGEHCGTYLCGVRVDHREVGHMCAKRTPNLQQGVRDIRVGFSSPCASGLAHRPGESGLAAMVTAA